MGDLKLDFKKKDLAAEKDGFAPCSIVGFQIKIIPYTAAKTITIMGDRYSTSINHILQGLQELYHRGI